MNLCITLFTETVAKAKKAETNVKCINKVHEPASYFEQTYLCHKTGKRIVVVVVVLNGSYSAAPYSSPDRECVTKKIAAVNC